MALAARWWRLQCGGSIRRSSTAPVQQKQAVWRRHLQRGVSRGGAVAALTERQRQRSSGAMTAGRATEVLPAQGQRWQPSGGNDGGSGS